MDLKIAGKVIEILEEQSGEGRNGPWRKQDFVIETGGEYPKKICVTQWGDDIEKFGIGEGDELTAHIDIQSREYQGRWYTDVKAWRVEKQQASKQDAQEDAPPAGDPFDPGPTDFGPQDDGDDDLPF